MSLVKLENVTKIYRSDEIEFIALKGVSLELKKGEMLALMGASGSGKSTIMNIVGFLDQCTTGKYYFANQEVSSLTGDQLAHIRNQRIGFVFQSFFLLPRLTAIQNVMLPLSYRGIERVMAYKLAEVMLAKVKMHTFLKHKPSQLSGGQQQRVAIARALVGEPEIILADEPTGALDSATGNEILDLLQELHQKEHRTLLIVTHDSNVSQRCERIVTMRDGRIEENQ